MEQQWIAPSGQYSAPVHFGPGTPYAALHPQHQAQLAFAQQHQIQSWAPGMPRAFANAPLPPDMFAPGAPMGHPDQAQAFAPFAPMGYPDQSQAFAPFAPMGHPNLSDGFAPFAPMGYSNQSDCIAPYSPMCYPNPFDQHVIPYPQHPLPPDANPNKAADSNGYQSQDYRGSGSRKRRSPSPSSPPASQVPNLGYRGPQAGRDRSESPGFVPDCEDAFPALNGDAPLPQASRKPKEALDGPFSARVPQRQKNLSDGGQIAFEIELNPHIESLHVGVSDEALKERQKMTGIPICSSFYDKKTALDAIKATIAANGMKIGNWVSDQNGPRRLELFGAKADAPVGNAICGSDPNPIPVKSAAVILQRDASNPKGWIVLTAYPKYK